VILPFSGKERKLPMNRALSGVALFFIVAVSSLSPWLCKAEADKEEPRLPQRPLNPDDCDKLAVLPLEQLRAKLGPPRLINRQILYQRYLEQWLYDHPYLVRVEIDCVRGRKPHLLTVQPWQPGKP
jgi:hypothetical protein